jgi:hypothetical protein
MTTERALHVKEEFCYENEYGMRQLSWHLLKFHEILDASTKKLPRLQSIELELHTYCWDEVLLTRIKVTNRDGVLWINWSDVHICFDHDLQRWTEGVGLIPWIAWLKVEALTSSVLYFINELTTTRLF